MHQIIDRFATNNTRLTSMYSHKTIRHTGRIGDILYLEIAITRLHICQNPLICPIKSNARTKEMYLFYAARCFKVRFCSDMMYLSCASRWVRSIREVRTLPGVRCVPSDALFTHTPPPEGADWCQVVSRLLPVVPTGRGRTQWRRSSGRHYWQRVFM